MDAEYTADESRQSDADALKEFLLDIDCLNPLSEWTSKFNMFDILKISRTEIRHSNMLAWLLNPNENHGLGDSVIRGFIRYVTTFYSDDSEIFDTLLMDCHDFTLHREWRNIDILAVSQSEKFVLCIENKIYSGEHSNQLNRYRELVETTYPNCRKMYVFLSPEGTESSDSDNWCSMSYGDVLDIVENARGKTKLLPEAALMIDNYIDTLRRDIVGDEKLARICEEIYAKHQRALDLIYEHIPDRASQVASIIHDWAKMMTEKGEIVFVPEKSGKTYTHFKTKAMSELLPDSENSLSDWGTPNYYFYEIKNDGNEFRFQFSLNSKNIPDHLRTVCDKINECFPAKRKNNENWQWRTPFSTRKANVGDELSEEKIFKQLAERFKELMSFEADLIKRISSDE
ncbi:MAG: PD-(D/E)XK nuclease family protein [Abditibacteriota bacterium]|nr:PD-(D/E)XK nuclease family protein [Abditibacteriota bacterium]